MRWWMEAKYLVRKLNRKRAETELAEEIRTRLELVYPMTALRAD